MTWKAGSVTDQIIPDPQHCLVLYLKQVDVVEQGGGGEVGGGMLPPVLNAGGGGAVFHQQNGEGDFILSFIHIFCYRCSFVELSDSDPGKKYCTLKFKKKLKEKRKHLKICYFSCNFSICSYVFGPYRSHFLSRKSLISS
jgi:hypothetical protein